MLKKMGILVLCLAVIASGVSLFASPAKAVTEDQIETAIEDGLEWLAGQQAVNGSWGNSVGHTGLALLKFEDRAGELVPPLDPFDPNYEYSANVTAGLNYIFSLASVVAISVQNAGDPDTNDNDNGVAWAFNTYSETYYTSIAMMAIAASKAPNRAVSGGACHGWTYQQVLQDAVDFMAYSQSDPTIPPASPCGNAGGWYYEHRNNQCSADNSNGGYAVLGLGYAQVSPFNCTVPGWVYTQLSSYCDYIQNDQGADYTGDTNTPDFDGGSGYTGPSDWVNILKTGNLLYQMALTGDTEATQRVQDGLDYLERHWGDVGHPGWKPKHYQAMYTSMKGLEAMGIFTFGDPAIDWYADFSDTIVSQQNVNGSWSDCPCYVGTTGYIHGCDAIMCTTWALLTLERSVAPLIRPVVSDIPDQCVPAGDSFATINLDDYVEDGDNDDSELTWTASGQSSLTVSIDLNRVATVNIPGGWIGSETITFTATDPDAQSDSDGATFTVSIVPVVGDIPDQTAPFTTFDLDNYLIAPVPSSVTWTSSGNVCLGVSIDGNNVVTVDPLACSDPETITFTATAVVCGQDVSDSDDAVFTPNQPPDTSGAEADPSCLWPPNHKFVDISIVGVTDPDGDPVTITITGITSDEPTATDKGSGGAKHAPDADGVGTATASVRAERSGDKDSDGRVYVISFTASDGRGGESEGSVEVKVPHDQSDIECPAIDNGQDYDATQIN